MASTNLIDYYKTEHEINGIIHVGTNDLQEFDFYNRFPGPQLYFEPISEQAEVVRNKTAAVTDKQITVETLACGSEDIESVILHKSLGDLGNSSSLLKKTKMYHDRYTNSASESEAVNVRMVKLDTYMQTHKFGPYNTLVIDTEGFELEVLRGAVNTLKDIKYLMTEIWLNEFYKGYGTYQEINGFLLEQGFILSAHNDFNNAFGNYFYTKPT
jgi:FkbM family methyltransferase